MTPAAISFSSPNWRAIKMTTRKQYAPGPAGGAQIEKDGEKWTLVLVRELRHSPEKVWAALTDPAQLREWAPFDADRSLASGGPAQLSTGGTPQGAGTAAARPATAARVGTLRRRSQPGERRPGEALDGGHAAGVGDDGHSRRSAAAARV